MARKTSERVAESKGTPCEQPEISLRFQATTPSIAHLDRWPDGVLSPMYVVFQVKPSLDSDFFYHWLSSAEARQRIRLAAQRSVRETVSFDDLGSISLPIPSLGRQPAVARFLNESQREIELLRQLAQKYQRQKRGLMQKLLTGEWRVTR